MSCVHKVRWSVRPPEDCRFRLSVSHYKDRIVAPDEYAGATVVTPSDSEQVLATKDKLVREDITVTGITGTQVITENGEYDVVGDKLVTVDVTGILDRLLEVVSSVTPNENAYSLEFPCDKKTGMYIIVSDPPGTREFASQQKLAETINMVEFDIRGVAGTLTVYGAVTICYHKKPTSSNETDWWTAKINLRENSVTVEPTSGRYPFLAGVTYYLLRVKGA